MKLSYLQTKQQWGLPHYLYNILFPQWKATLFCSGDMYIELLTCIPRHGYIEALPIRHVKHIVVDIPRSGVLAGFDLAVRMITNTSRTRVLLIGKLIRPSNVVAQLTVIKDCPTVKIIQFTSNSRYYRFANGNYYHRLNSWLYYTKKLCTFVIELFSKLSMVLQTGYYCAVIR